MSNLLEKRGISALPLLTADMATADALDAMGDFDLLSSDEWFEAYPPAKWEKIITASLGGIPIPAPIRLNVCGLDVEIGACGRGRFAWSVGGVAAGNAGDCPTACRETDAAIDRHLGREV